MDLTSAFSRTATQTQAPVYSQQNSTYTSDKGQWDTLDMNPGSAGFEQSVRNALKLGDPEQVLRLIQRKTANAGGLDKVLDIAREAHAYMAAIPDFHSHAQALDNITGGAITAANPAHGPDKISPSPAPAPLVM